jgi:tetratricopeptide (TPR) repeat protein
MTKRTIILFIITFFSVDILCAQVTWDKKILTFPVTKNTDIVYDYPTEIEDEAVKYYNKAINATSSNSELAIEYYLKAIKIEPTFIQAYDNLGQLFRVLEKYNLSIECYNKSISLYPKGHIAHINLATLYSHQNNSEKAILHYKEVIQIKPNSPEGYYGVAKIYLDDQKLNSALEYAEKALSRYKKKPNIGIADSYAVIGLVYYYLDNPTEAKKYIQLAKSKYQEYNVEEVFHTTFPKWLLTELSIK